MSRCPECDSFKVVVIGYNLEHNHFLCENCGFNFSKPKPTKGQLQEGSYK